jgi:hypothetical protein
VGIGSSGVRRSAAPALAAANRGCPERLSKTEHHLHHGAHVQGTQGRVLLGQRGREPDGARRIRLLLQHA